MRVLVAIANYGRKNRRYLAVLLDEYRRMEFDVDIVVLSEVRKDLGDDVEVIVGLPGPSPRTLPFAHRALFADRCNDYDLFIYSEDDTRITARHISAFLEESDRLPEPYIPGFLRFEIAPDGKRRCSSIHSKYGWLPDTVERINDQLYAQTSNAHSACFLLRRPQLERALNSGNFLIQPHVGREDMMVAAATDPYINCGLVRVIPLSRIEDFMVHHLPNAYIGKLGLPEKDFQIQLKALTDPKLDRRRLFETRTKLDTVAWDKSYYERPIPELREVLTGAQRVLTVGCGSGDAEHVALGVGADVVGIPLDDVIGAAARQRGVRTLPPDFDDAFAQLEERSFDRILFLSVLHHIEDPIELLTATARFLRDDGEIIIYVPNIYREIARSIVRRQRRPRPSSGGYDRDGVHPTSRRIVRRWVRSSGLVPSAMPSRRSLRSVLRTTVTSPRVVVRASKSKTNHRNWSHSILRGVNASGRHGK